jgi:hypothetical protein
MYNNVTVHVVLLETGRLAVFFLDISKMKCYVCNEHENALHFTNAHRGEAKF